MKPNFNVIVFSWLKVMISQKWFMKLLDSLAHKNQRLSKIHKQDVNCCPILLIMESAQHELAAFLAALLQPVLELYLTNCINDSFILLKFYNNLK